MKKILSIFTCLCVMTSLMLTSCSEDKVKYIDSPVKGVVVQNATDNVFYLEKDQTIQVEAATVTKKATETTGYNYIFSSSNSDVFTVNESGLITAKSSGRAVLKVLSAEDTDVWTTCFVVVTFNPVMPERINVSPTLDDYYTAVGRTLNLSEYINLSPANASYSKLVYTSSDKSVAIVDEVTGFIKTLSVGDAIITVETLGANKVKAEVKLQVRNIGERTIYTDRTAWGVTASHPYFADGTVTGKPECLIDESMNSCLCLVKPGKTMPDIGEGRGSLTVGANEKVYFIVDMLQEHNMDYVVLRHRTYTNVTPNIRVHSLSVFGSNDGVNFDELIKNKAIPVGETIVDVTVDLQIGGSYRYVKVTIDSWHSGGNTVQMSDFNVGYYDYLPL